MSSGRTKWLNSRPPSRIAGRGLLLERARPTDNADLVAAVNDSLDNLSPWMPWAQEQATPESIGAFLSQASTDWDAGTEFQYVLRRVAGSIVGCSGLHAQLGPSALEIGYWVRVGQLRRGVATAAAAALTAAALELAEVDRVEIRCDAANSQSAKVPPKLGYRLDRIEHRMPSTPGETDQYMIWVLDADEARTVRAEPR
jgi:RimJ/RimL family protein N-acetyltransferase